MHSVREVCALDRGAWQGRGAKRLHRPGAPATARAHMTLPRPHGGERRVYGAGALADRITRPCSDGNRDVLENGGPRGEPYVRRRQVAPRWPGATSRRAAGATAPPDAHAARVRSWVSQAGGHASQRRRGHCDAVARLCELCACSWRHPLRLLPAREACRCGRGDGTGTVRRLPAPAHRTAHEHHATW